MKAIFRNVVSTSYELRSYKGPASSWLRPEPLRPGPVLPVVWASQPIRAQVSSHVICLDQSEASDAGSVGLTTGPRTPAPAEAETRVWTPERSEDSGCEHCQWRERGTTASSTGSTPWWPSWPPWRRSTFYCGKISSSRYGFVCLLTCYSIIIMFML